MSTSYRVFSGWQYAREEEHEDFTDALRCYRERRHERYGAVLLGKDADFGGDDYADDGLSESERARLEEP